MNFSYKKDENNANQKIIENKTDTQWYNDSTVFNTLWLPWFTKGGGRFIISHPTYFQITQWD